MTSVSDAECVRFLQEVLPRLRLRWPGFRKVRRQVRKRLRRRLEALGLPDLAAYRERLELDPDELERLDAMCRISISRFHRGIRVFERVRREVLPQAACDARAAGEPLRCWSAGCASGEEPYTLSLIWQRELSAQFPDVTLRVLATDVDAGMLARARAAEYTTGSLKDLPPAWRASFEWSEGQSVFLPEAFRRGVELVQHDLRSAPPAGPFRLILCRYLAFTYFAPDLQAEVLERLCSVLEPNGFLIVAPKEDLPARPELTGRGDGIYQRSP